MGRLVDTNDVYNVLTEYYHHKTATQHMALKDALDKVETVDAIPVKWIKEKIQSLRNENSYTSYHLSECFKALLIDWRRGKKIEPD